MKNYIKFILIAIIFLGVACEKDNSIETYQLGSEFFISDGGFTSLDDEVIISIENQKANLSEVVLTHSGVTDMAGEAVVPPKTDLGKVSIASGLGSIALNYSDLGISEIDWVADLKCSAVIDGKPFSRSHSISVADPISMEAPEMKYQDSLYHVLFSIEPVSAVVTNVMVETKVSSSGTYVEVVEDFLAIDSVALNAADYAIGDTIYVKVTGETSTKSASSVIELVVNPKPLSMVASFELDSTANIAYDFINANIVDAALVGDSADIQMSVDTLLGGYNLGFFSANNAEFVKGTANDYDVADSLSVIGVDYSSSITSVDSVGSGEVYFYRTYRSGGDYVYGIMQVIDVAKPEGVLEDSKLLFEHKYY